MKCKVCGWDEEYPSHDPWNPNGYHCFIADSISIKATRSGDAYESESIFVALSLLWFYELCFNGTL